MRLVQLLVLAALVACDATPTPTTPALPPTPAAAPLPSSVSDASPPGAQALPALDPPARAVCTYAKELWRSPRRIALRARPGASSPPFASIRYARHGELRIDADGAFLLAEGAHVDVRGYVGDREAVLRPTHPIPFGGGFMVATEEARLSPVRASEGGQLVVALGDVDGIQPLAKTEATVSCGDVDLDEAFFDTPPIAKQAPREAALVPNVAIPLRQEEGGQVVATIKVSWTAIVKVYETKPAAARSAGGAHIAWSNGGVVVSGWVPITAIQAVPPPARGVLRLGEIFIEDDVDPAADKPEFRRCAGNVPLIADTGAGRYAVGQLHGARLHLIVPDTALPTVDPSALGVAPVDHARLLVPMDMVAACAVEPPKAYLEPSLDHDFEWLVDEAARGCAPAELKSSPNAAGKISVYASVAENGKVVASRVVRDKRLSSSFEDCVLAAVRQKTFQPLTNGLELRTTAKLAKP